MSATETEKKGIPAVKHGEYLYYKNRPLVRDGQTICYGDLSESHVLRLTALTYKEENGQTLPDLMMIQVIDSKDRTKIYKQGTENGLYQSWCLGLVWLQLALGLKQEDALI